MQKSTLTIPTPPEYLVRAAERVHPGSFAPAPELWEVVKALFILKGGAVFNEHHKHLESAEIGFLWTNVTAVSKGREILGTAEIFFPRGAPWQKARQRQQVLEWFDCEPDFLITLSAPYVAASIAQDVPANVGALFDHELYHCGQAVDDYGDPRFNQVTGLPVWTMVGHDVEEHIGVVERWGAYSPGLERLVAAANRGPTIGRAAMDGLCGTCMRRVA